MQPGLVTLYDIWLGNGTGLFLKPHSPHGAGFLREVSLANHLATNDNLTTTTKRQNTYQRKLTIHKKGP